MLANISGSITQELIIAAREYIARENDSGAKPAQTNAEQLKQLFNAWFDEKIKEFKKMMLNDWKCVACPDGEKVYVKENK